MSPSPFADAVVVALKSRTIEPALAVEQSLQALAWLRAQGAGQIYFKVCSTFDSTDRGNIGPVAEALMVYDAHGKIVRANPAAYLCGTLLGMLPRTAAVVFLAAGLKEAMLTSPRNRAMIIAGIVATLIALGVIGYLANQALAKVTQPQASHNNQDSRGEHGEAELRKT